MAIAAGLAEAAAGDGDDAVATGPSVLLETEAYVAVLERLDGHGHTIVGAAEHAGLAFAVVSGVVVVRARPDDGARTLRRGGTGGLAAGEAVRLLNPRTEPARLVIVRAPARPVAAARLQRRPDVR